MAHPPLLQRRVGAGLRTRHLRTFRREPAGALDKVQRRPVRSLAPDRLPSAPTDFHLPASGTHLRVFGRAVKRFVRVLSFPVLTAYIARPDYSDREAEVVRKRTEGRKKQTADQERVTGVTGMTPFTLSGRANPLAFPSPSHLFGRDRFPPYCSDRPYSPVLSYSAPF